MIALEEEEEVEEDREVSTSAKLHVSFNGVLNLRMHFESFVVHTYMYIRRNTCRAGYVSKRLVRESVDSLCKDGTDI